MKKIVNHKLKLPVLSCNDLSYNIGYKKILKNISFEIFPNEIILLRGENGSGKSTLLKLIFHNKFHSQFFNIEKKIKIGFCGHEAGLYSTLNLMENLRYFSAISGNGTYSKNLERYIDLFQLRKSAIEPIFTYSKGMKQKAGILCAIATSPNIILFDEPTSGLDEQSNKVFFEFILDFKKNGSVLWVTHEKTLDKNFQDRNFLISNGELKNDN